MVYNSQTHTNATNEDKKGENTRDNRRKLGCGHRQKETFTMNAMEQSKIIKILIKEKRFEETKKAVDDIDGLIDEIVGAGTADADIREKLLRVKAIIDGLEE